MFGFARSKREAAQQKAAPKLQGNLPPQSPRPGGDPLSAPSTLPVIADVNVLREMNYISLQKFGLNQLHAHVACMRHPEKGYLLLVSKEIWGRPAFF